MPRGGGAGDNGGLISDRNWGKLYFWAVLRNQKLPISPSLSLVGKGNAYIFSDSDQPNNLRPVSYNPHLTGETVYGTPSMVSPLCS